MHLHNQHSFFLTIWLVPRGASSLSVRLLRQCGLIVVYAFRNWSNYSASVFSMSALKLGTPGKAEIGERLES